MFEYNGIWLRAIESSDLEFMYKIRSDPSTAEMVGTLFVKSLDEQDLWLKSLREDKTKAYYIFGVQFTKIGYLRFDEIDLINRSMRVGGDIDQKYRGQGYGQKMMELIKKFCFDYMNMHRLWLLVFSTNLPAKHIYDKAGFKKEGVMLKAVYRNGEYIDYEMWSLIK